MTGRIRRLYGASPLHLLGVLACVSGGGFALTHMFDSGPARNVALWLGGAIVGHDLILYPLYSLAGRVQGEAFQRAGARRFINHVRIPTLLSGLMLLVYFPLILRVSPKLELYSSLTNTVYLGRWLGISAGLFGVSALICVAQLVRARARRPAAG